MSIVKPFFKSGAININAEMNWLETSPRIEIVPPLIDPREIDTGK
jgi:hypothetical protein